jgi:hypothetical protein
VERKEALAAAGPVGESVAIGRQPAAATVRPLMRPPVVRLVALLAMAVSTSGCTQTSEPSPEASSPAPAATPVATAPLTTSASTPVPGFEDWQLINPQAVRLSLETGGTLVLDLVGSVLWFNADKGVLFYREVAGDFRATATVRTSSTSDPSLPPGQDGTVQLAGLMARTEVPAENSVFIVSGSIGKSTGLETKTTESSRSVYIQRGLPTGGDAELRLCRIGSTFLLWWRHVDSNEDWMHMSTFDRKDMPGTVQVGVNIYTDGVPDITARFEHLTIEPIPGGAGC